MKYPGAKTNSGITQWLINNIPFHSRYFELFAGTAALYRAKRPANENILTDLSEKMVQYLISRNRTNNTLILQADALDILKKLQLTRKDFIYLNPPYPAAARRSGKSYYKHEMLDDSDHVQLLSSMLEADANIMISTRQNDLYEIYLKDWRKEYFDTIDRCGKVMEIIYMNYPPPGYPASV